MVSLKKLKVYTQLLLYAITHTLTIPFKSLGSGWFGFFFYINTPQVTVQIFIRAKKIYILWNFWWGLTLIIIHLRRVSSFVFHIRNDTRV